MFKKSSKAFTLIELLVVIAIIGILATVSVLALSNARAKARDAKRAGDVKQVQTALELFFNDNNRYPTVEEWATGKIFSTTTDATSTYMQILPSAPTPADGSCTNNQNIISYIPTDNGASYSISFCLGSNTGTLTPGPKCMTPGGVVDTDCSDETLPFVCGNNLTDSRDGKIYSTIRAGSKCWMAESLNVGTRIDAVSSAPCTLATVASQSSSNYAYSCQQNDSQIEKYCYNNDDGQCNEYGGLYEWTEAMQLPVSCANVAVNCNDNPSDPCCNYSTPRQGACPSGWHIPSSAEFQSLYSVFGGISVAGNALKETGFDHWNNNNTDATNISGFSALAAGRFGKGGFNNTKGASNGAYNMIWTSSTSGDQSNRAYIYSGNGSVDVFAALRDRAFSVRCVADQTIACTDNIWSPDPNTACVGQTLTQISNCGNTRSIDGTASETWSPDPSTACVGQTLTQTSNCGNNRDVAGTTPETWTPDLDTVCGTIKQNSNCGNNRKTTGTLVCSGSQTCLDNACVTLYDCGTATISDADGNSYQTLLINDQCWTKSNLKTTKYNDGSSIEYPLDDTSWQSNTAGAYTWYDYNIGYKDTYGALYNWYAAVNPKGLCPTGWHVPSVYELDALRSYLGGSSAAGGKLIIGGSSGFNMPFGGVYGGTFYNMGSYGYLWSSTEYWAPSAYFRYINGSSFDGFSVNEYNGYSIRCLRDSLYQ
ncbi:MAG: FISUMP domain-containing protein [Candidatus Falkowbacteria bacterium]